MTEPGYILISRKLLESETWLDQGPFSEVAAWIDLIGLAAWRPTTATVNAHEVPLRRGEFCHSYRYLAKRWGWTKGKAEWYLGKLVRTGALHRHPADAPADHLPPVYLVVKYDRYQRPGKGQQTPQQTDHRTNKNTGNTDNPKIVDDLKVHLEPKTPSKKPSASRGVIGAITPATSPAPAPAAPTDSGAEADRPTPSPNPSPAPRELTWPQRAVQAARDAGFDWPESRIVRAVAPGVKQDGPELALRAWAGYLKFRPYEDWDIAAQQGKRVPEAPVRDTRFVRPEDYQGRYSHWLRECLRPTEWAAREARRKAVAS